MDTFNIALPNILQGLGKPTRRGIKKCPKCGTFNGTKGTYCKNKQCGVSLRSANSNTFDLDAVKLVSGTYRQVYSVHVKDAVSECRGFVQLPLVQFCTEEKGSVMPEVALCFVDSCQRSFDNSILKCHEEGGNTTESEKCIHIKLALKSETVAKPIAFEGNVLSQMRIPYQIKEKLKLLAADNQTPLVQRVSSNVMAVKCQVTPKQPLGYLHFTFLKGKNKGYEKHFCTCTEYMSSACHEKSASVRYKCIHYYACIAALASDRTYFEEFSLFINNELHLQDKSPGSPKIVKPIQSVKVKRTRINIISNQVIKKPNKEPTTLKKERVKRTKCLIRRCKKIVPKIYPIEIKVLNDPSDTEKLTDTDVNWSLLDWLAFVTESINRTMQFINCGIINSQVFYIPEVFYDSFKKRIPVTYQEQATDIGSVFYSIMNINHVKDIFDTPKVKLRIAKKFINIENNGYVEYDENIENETVQYSSSFIFFLNVGPSTVDESDNCNNAFIIEWLPNICPVTKIGQLKLQYKYGRKSI